MKWKLGLYGGYLCSIFWSRAVGLGSRVYGLGLRVLGLGLRV